MTKYIDRYYLNGEEYGIKFGGGPRLPVEYQEVEYIESTRTGNQRISTGYIANSSIRITTKFRTLSDIQDGENSVIFGTTYNSWAYAAPLAYYFYKPSENIARYQFGASGGDVVYTDMIFGVDYELDYSLNDVTLDGVTQTLNKSTNAYEITLFYGNAKGGPTRIYSLQIYTGTTLERDFVPCYRKLDSVTGMYDLVNDVFYTNSGSGTFVKGNDVN